MKVKKNSNYYCLTYKLDTNYFIENILDKKMETLRQVYNALVNVERKNYNKMTNEKAYHEALKGYGIAKKSKDTESKVKNQNILNELRKKCGIVSPTSGGENFRTHRAKMSKWYKKWLPDVEAERVEKNLWSAYDKLIFGDGRKVYHKKYDEFNTIELRKKKQTIIKDGKILVNGPLNSKGTFYTKYWVPLIRKHEGDIQTNKYIEENVVSTKIVRVKVKGKNTYFAKLTVEIPKDKDVKFTNYTCGKGTVGIDLGMGKIAICSDKTATIIPLSSKEMQETLQKLEELDIKIEASRRATNPNNYTDDGQIIRGKKLVWHKSKRYKRLIAQKQELSRKVSETKKFYRATLVNTLTSNYDTIVYEDGMSIKEMMIKEKETSFTDTGTCAKKNHKGKVIRANSPADFRNKIDISAKRVGCKVIKANTYVTKATQYTGVNDTYNHLDANEPAKLINGRYYDRDLQAAYNLQHIKEDGITYDKKGLKKDWNNFTKLHDSTISQEDLKEKLDKYNYYKQFTV